MTRVEENFLNFFGDTNFISEVSKSKFGIERECLRVYNKAISKKSHPAIFGSSLFNRYITTDFSESLLEFITPPISSKDETIKFLDTIQHFVSHNINNEILWPFSMPPYIHSDDDIRIAHYGSSNEALFKMLYRRGLSYRYGRKMQTIAGVHFNYSFSENLWHLDLLNDTTSTINEVKEVFYFRALRNINRTNWLIIYLFGASPIINDLFISFSQEKFKKIKNSYYLPHATSLRMSDIGYQNTSQSNIRISLNSLDDYAHDIKKYTRTESNLFSEMNINNNQHQINTNILQTEDEYYSSSRPKNSSPSKQRMSSRLLDSGIEYIEFRSLDINPFHKTGIDYKTLVFLEMYINYCTFKESPFLSEIEIKDNQLNNINVARNGRKPDHILLRDGEKISLKSWGREVLEEMHAVICQSEYEESIITEQIEKIDDPDKTLSALFFDKFCSSNLSFDEFGQSIGESNKIDYLNKSHLSNRNWDVLSQEAKKAKQDQINAESKDDISFSKYLDEYFSQ
tara:strand:- start:4651 stop:6186 length:1536 start_codon:yes stop_codon:yes gene_type:complete